MHGRGLRAARCPAVGEPDLEGRAVRVRHGALLVALGEIRRKPAPGDLARRPPQRVPGELALAAAAGRIAAQPPGAGAGEQHAAQDRMERLRLDGGAGAGGDRLGGGVRLLGGDPALLDREVGDVAGRPDVARPAYAPALVDRQEPLRIGRQALDRAAGQPRQGDDPVDLDALAGRSQLERSLPRGLGVGAGVQPDPDLREAGDERLGRLDPEDPQRRVLRSDQVQLRVEAGLVRALGGQQRELVDRQAPGDAGRDHERDPPRIAALDVLHDAVHGIGVVRAPEGGRARERRLGARAERDQQRVVAQLTPTGRLHGVRLGVHGLQAVDDTLEVKVARDRVERVAAGDRERERVGDADRPVRELVVGGEQRDGDALAGEIAQREGGFQAGRAGAGDQDLQRHLRLRVRGVRGFPRTYAVPRRRGTVEATVATPGHSR